MNNTQKIGVLVVTLGAPLLIYALLIGCGKNNYELPVITPEFYDTTAVDNTYRIDSLPDFALTDQRGLSFTRDSVRGKILAADFIFTRCEGICPRMSTQMTRVQREFADNPEVLIVSHTVDPQNDDVETLQGYADLYEAIPGKWHFLTGKKDEIYSLARYGYNLPAGEDGGPEAFLHSEKMILIDQKGRIRGYYDGTDAEDVDRLITEIRILLDNEQST